MGVQRVQFDRISFVDSNTKNKGLDNLCRYRDCLSNIDSTALLQDLSSRPTPEKSNSSPASTANSRERGNVGEF